MGGTCEKGSVENGTALSGMPIGRVIVGTFPSAATSGPCSGVGDNADRTAFIEVWL